MSVLKYKNENGEWVALPNAEVKTDTREWRYFEAEKTGATSTLNTGIVTFDFSPTGIDFEKDENWFMVMNLATNSSNARNLIVSPIFTNMEFAMQTNSSSLQSRYQVWQSGGSIAPQYVNDNPLFPGGLLEQNLENIWHEDTNGWLKLYNDYLTFDESSTPTNTVREISQKVKLYYLA